MLVARGNLSLKMPVGLQGLWQAKEMLSTVIAHQTLSHLVAGFDAPIAQAAKL